MFKCAICGYCPILEYGQTDKTGELSLYGHVVGNSPNIKENQYLILCKKHKEEKETEDQYKALWSIE